ncbi:hypothetical protein ACA910_004810 [Epithemia clementina (nom. ined.)]
MTNKAYSESEFKTIRVLSFSNRKEDWYKWSFKFWSMAEQQGYDEIIDGTVVVPDDSINLKTISDDVTRENVARTRRANKTGYRDLAVATTEISFTLVGESKTTELPKGDLHLAWSKLVGKWEPKESEDKVELLETFQPKVLDNIQTDPVNWLTELDRNRQELRKVGHDMDNNAFLLLIMMSLPKEYVEVVRDMKQKMRTGALDYEETEKLLSDQYKILKKIHNWDNEELALTGTTNMGRKGKVPKKKFKGKSCPHCQ